jgi:tetratricopeptide (TPR) repeat protein
MIAKAMDDRAGKGKAYGNLGNAYQSLGDFSEAIECHTENLDSSTCG